MQLAREAETNIPDAFRRLSVEVDSLTIGAQDPHHTGLVGALRELANAVELLPEVRGRDQAPAKLRDVAQRIEASSPSSLDHADMVQEAFKIALQTLVARNASPGREAEYRNSVEALSRGIQTLNVDRPLLKQWQTTIAALRAATNAVYLAHGGEAPFGQPETNDIPRATVGSAEDELEEARAEVLELGQTNWTNARQASAKALSSIADVIEASDHGREQRDRISKIRFQAARLKNTDSPSFDHGQWVKIGLTMALDALDTQDGVERVVAPWTRAARRAVGGIEERGSLGFQRAALQDGFRSTVDAFLVASQAARLCR